MITLIYQQQMDQADDILQPVYNPPCDSPGSMQNIAMNATEHNNKSLASFSHGSAVRSFFEFYLITCKPPSFDLFGETLNCFSGMLYKNLSKTIKLRQGYTSPVSERVWSRTFILIKETFGSALERKERAQEAIPKIIAEGQQFGYYRKKLARRFT